MTPLNSSLQINIVANLDVVGSDGYHLHAISPTVEQLYQDAPLPGNVKITATPPLLRPPPGPNAARKPLHSTAYRDFCSAKAYQLVSSDQPTLLHETAATPCMACQPVRSLMNDEDLFKLN